MAVGFPTQNKTVRNEHVNKKVRFNHEKANSEFRNFFMTNRIGRER